MNQIRAVILAAGSSSRLGFNKLCVKIDGQAVIRKTVQLFMEYADKVVVVTGFERERIEHELKGLPVLFAHNPDHFQGMSSSVKTALPHVTDVEGILFHLGDKPLVSPNTIERTIEMFRQGSAIVLPVFNGIKGHPVLVRSRLFLDEMAAVEGDMGLRKLVERHTDEVRTVEGDEGAVLDIDSEEDIAELARRGFTIEKNQG
jgi:molybdenum cofactor cytidylyltransferase